MALFRIYYGVKDTEEEDDFNLNEDTVMLRLSCFFFNINL
jgi:hypothetical protein